MKFSSVFFVGLILAVVTGLWAQDPNTLSKKELFSRARDALLTSIQNKDYDRVSEAYAYLQANLSEGAPLSIFDEYMIDMELGRYADAIPKLAHIGRMMFDASYTPEKKVERIIKDDALHKYLENKFAQQKDSLINIVDSSGIDPGLKDLYATLIYAAGTVGAAYYVDRYDRVHVHLSVEDTSYVDRLIKRAHSYVEKYPNTEYANLIKTSILPLVEKYIDRKRKLDKDPYTYHYYTGGFHVFGGLWRGFMTGGATDYLQTKMGSSLNVEMELQFLRVAIGFFYNRGLISRLENYDDDGDFEDVAYGLGLGVVVFDMRYLKIEPFIGFSAYNFSNIFEEEGKGAFFAGLNSDIRLYTTPPSFIVFSLVLRLKYQALIGKFSYHRHFEPCCDETKVYPPKDIDANYVVHQFGAEIGLSLW